MSSIPQTYTISDFIEWDSKNRLILNPDFQRGSVWIPAARVFLIDTILNDLPIPQVYFRTRISPTDQTILREVVDGQQRLRAILDFAKNKLQLSSKSPKFKDQRYSSLDENSQTKFLSYKISAVQLIDASDAEVIEVFARLNSYSVKVTPAELRHAEYTEPVKWAVYDATRSWHELWSDFEVVSKRDTIRLRNNTLMAELFMAFDWGLNSGGETNVNKYYRMSKGEDDAHFNLLREKIDRNIKIVVDRCSHNFRDTVFFKSPNFLILTVAVAFLSGEIKSSELTEGVDELRGKGVDWKKAERFLSEISQSFDVDEEQSQHPRFVAASKSSTHSKSSRKTRFNTLVNGIATS